MKQEILDFYSARNQPVDQIILVGKRKYGVTRDAIEAACEDIYYKQHQYKRIMIVRMVFTRARQLQVEKKIKERDRIAVIERRLDWMNRPALKKLWQSIIFPRTLAWDYDKWQ